MLRGYFLKQVYNVPKFEYLYEWFYMDTLFDMIALCDKNHNLQDVTNPKQKLC